VISEVEQVLPSMKQLHVKLERKSQNPVPPILNLMAMLLTIQIKRMGMAHNLQVEHLQLDSLLEMQGKP
jgi:hypothetical protein